MARDLTALFEEHLERKKFFKPHDQILIACSGGPDSVALFHLLEKIAPRYAWKLGVLHFNHQLRPKDAKRDEIFVKKLARRFGVPFYHGKGNVKKEAKKEKSSVEEAARKLRYGFFLRIARQKKYSKIVFAHTQDDQAETVLMRILQGTGLRGLSGIREKVFRGPILLVRPVLPFTKKELLSYLEKYSISFRTDKSNESLHFLRNRIRMKLIPSLRRDYNPRLVEALSRIPAIVTEENDLFSELEKLAWRKVLKRRTGRKVEFRRHVFLKLPAALQFRMVEKALKELHPQSGLSFDAWERLRRGLSRPRNCFSLPKDIDLALTSKNITLYKKKRPG